MLASNKKWTEDEDRMILALHAEGWSRGYIAQQLGVTRNMICGKLHRFKRARSSTVEPAAHNGEVAGSIPAGRTIPAPEPESEIAWPTLGKWQDVAPAVVVPEIVDETPLEEIALALVESVPPAEGCEPEAPAEPPKPPQASIYAAPSGMHRMVIVDDASGREYIAGDFSTSNRSAMYHMQRKPKGQTAHVYDDEGFWIGSCGHGASRAHQMRPRKECPL